MPQTSTNKILSEIQSILEETSKKQEMLETQMKEIHQKMEDFTNINTTKHSEIYTKLEILTEATKTAKDEINTKLILQYTQISGLLSSAIQ